MFQEADHPSNEQELSRVQKDLEKESFIIKKIIRSEGKGRNKRYLVSWMGYPEKLNSWIPASEIKQLK